VRVDTADLTLNGPNSETPGDDSNNRSNEATLRRKVIIDRVSGVTIDGFKIAEDDTSLTSGVSIRSGSSAIDLITVKNNIISGMSAGNSSDFTFGILSFDNPNMSSGTLSNATVKNNKISDIGADDSTQGVAVSLEALTDSSNGNTRVDGNRIRNISTLNKNSPGTGIALRPNFGGTDSAAEVTDDNTFENVDIAVSHPEGDTVNESDSLRLTNVATVVVDDDVDTNNKQRIFTPTIQNAVDAAASTATVDVRNGTFSEKVSIGENITLTGENASNTPEINGQVRITDSVSGSNTLEVSELDIDYDSGVVTNSGKAKSAVFFEQNQHLGVTFDNNTITGPTDANDGFAVYKQSSGLSGSPDDDIVFINNTFESGSSGQLHQLVVIEAADPEDSNNRVDIGAKPGQGDDADNSNIFDGTVNRRNDPGSNRGAALDHRAKSGDIQDNEFGDVEAPSGTDIEPIASATGANTSIKENGDGGNSGLDFEGESAAGNDIQDVLDESPADDTVEIKQGGDSSSKEKYTIKQDTSGSTSQPNQNTIEVNASDVIIEGKSSNGAELQVPGGSEPGIKVDSNGVEIKDVGITHSGSGGDTGIDINSDDCTLTNSEITVNPTAAVEINGNGNVIEDSRLNSAGSDGIGILIEDAAGGSGDNLIALNDIDSEFDDGIKIESGASDVDKVKIRFNNIRGDSKAINNNSETVVDARSNFWGDKTGPSSPSSGDIDDPETGRAADGDGDVISSDVRYDEFLEIPNGFILDTGSPSSGRDTDGDGLHEDFNDDGDHFPTDGYLFLRALRQGHFDRLADIDNPDGDLSTDYTTRFDFDGDGSDDISPSDVVSMVINRNRD
jgi:hypothetical protein